MCTAATSRSVVVNVDVPRKMNIGKEIGGGGSDYWDVSSDTDELATDPVQVRFHHSFLGASGSRSYSCSLRAVR